MMLVPRRAFGTRARCAAVAVLALALGACSSSGGKKPAADVGSGGAASAPVAGGTTTYTDVGALEAAAKKEGGQLKIYLGPELSGLAKGFEKAYPFVHISQNNIEPAAAATKYATELSAGVHDVDALFVFVTNVQPLNAQHGVQAVDVPNDKLVASTLQDANHLYHPIINSPSTLMYNTKLLPNGGPSDLKDLTDPQWKGKLVMDNPAAGGPAGLVMAEMKTELGADKWQAWMKALQANQPELTDSSSTSDEDLIRGERPLCICSYHDFLSQPAGTPVKAEIVNQSSIGMPATAGVFIVASHAAHPATAALFVNWLLSPTGGEQVIASTGRTPTVSGVPGAEKVSVPAGTKVAPFSTMGTFLSNPTPYSTIYKQVFGS